MKGLLQSVLDKGREQVTEVLAGIEHEYNIRRDIIVKPEKISFWDDGKPAIKIAEKEYGLTDYSFRQFMDRAGVPMTYYGKMVKYGETALAKQNIETMIREVSKDGVMIREVSGVAKGVLSPSYKRMDASVIFQSFVKTSLDSGYLPMRAANTESRYHVKFIRDKIIEVVDDEVAYGISITTSDYGASSLNIEMFLMRVKCSNMMLGYDLLRKIHLGKRLGVEFDDSGQFMFSERTDKLDSLTIASAVCDVIKASSEYESEIIEITKNGGKDIDLKAMLETLRNKKNLSKEDAEKAGVLYNAQDLSIEYLPPRKNLWRFANVISLLAKENEGDKAIELEKLSYDVLKM